MCSWQTCSLNLLRICFTKHKPFHFTITEGLHHCIRWMTSTQITTAVCFFKKNQHLSWKSQLEALACRMQLSLTYVLRQNNLFFFFSLNIRTYSQTTTRPVNMMLHSLSRLWWDFYNWSWSLLHSPREFVFQLFSPSSRCSLNLSACRALQTFPLPPLDQLQQAFLCALIRECQMHLKNIFSWVEWFLRCLGPTQTPLPQLTTQSLVWIGTQFEVREKEEGKKNFMMIQLTVRPRINNGGCLREKIPEFLGKKHRNWKRHEKGKRKTFMSLVNSVWSLL